MSNEQHEAFQNNRGKNANAHKMKTERQRTSFAMRTGRMCNMIIITSLQSFAAWFLEFIVRLFPPFDNKGASQRIHCQETHCHPTRTETRAKYQASYPVPGVFSRSPALVFFLFSAALLIKYLQVFSRIFF